MDSQHHIGAYRILAVLGNDSPAADARRFVARHRESPGAAVLLSVPPSARADDTAFHVRFRSEAENSRRLSGPAVLPLIGVSSPDAAGPWIVSEYVPALPLPDALALNGGGLPEQSVRALGAVLATTLADAHARGLAHAGISQSSVLLAADGPRLLGYGAVRAAAPEGQPRSAVHGLDQDFLPPEQLAGERPLPLGDVFSLGALLAFAATGRLRPDPLKIPEPLRHTITACLAPDPRHRPQAAALATELGTTPGPDWLPPSVAAGLSEQQVLVRSADAETQTPVPFDAAERGTSVPETASPGRRTLLVGALAGAGGLLLGGVGAYAASNSQKSAQPSRLRPARLPGVPPEPLWRAELPVDNNDYSTEFPPFIWRDRIVVHPAGRSVLGIDMETGERLWELDGFSAKGHIRDAGDGLVLIPDGRTFKTVSVHSGTVKWAANAYDPGSKIEFVSALALAGDTFWFYAGRIRRATPGGDPPGRVIAFDTKKREELWAVPATELGPGEPLLQEEFLLVPDTDGVCTALDRRTGKELWTQTYPGVFGVGKTPVYIGTPEGILVASIKRELTAFEMRRGETVWSLTSEQGSYGQALHHDSSVYVTDTFAYTYALDAASGELKWKREHGLEVVESMRFPVTTLSRSGRTVLASTAASVDAYSAVDGKLRWRFTAVGEGKKKGFTGAVVAHGKDVVLVQNDRTLYALPVE